MTSPVRRAFVAVAVCLVFAAALPAQQEGCRRRALTVSVIDEHVQPVAGLSVHDFSASVSGTPAEVASVTSCQSRHRVILLLDASAGMNRAVGEWDLARALAADALRVSAKAFRAGFVVFDSAARESYPPAENPQRAAEALREVHPAPGGADKKNEHGALWDTLKDALTLLDPPEFGDAIWVITNGEDASSRATANEIGALALARGVRVSVVLFNPATSFPEVPVIANSAVFDLPAHTGGQVVRVEGAQGTFRNRQVTYRLTASQFKDLDAAIAVLYAATQFAMRLEVVLPEELKTPTEWKLSIAAPKGLKIPWRVSYPTLLDACAAPAASSPP